MFMGEHANPLVRLRGMGKMKEVDFASSLLRERIFPYRWWFETMSGLTSWG